ncbi:MAG: AsmA family protein [Pseudomonadota bacterium]
MSTWSKVLIGVALAALVIFAAVVLAVVLIFEPDNYRGYVVRTVERSTGRDFELTGDLGLDVLPCCSVSLGPARLGNPEGFPEAEFARVRTAFLSLELWPLLLRREVSIDAIRIEGIELDLVRLPDGRANWRFDDAPEPEAGPGEEEATGGGLAGLTIDSLAVSGGRIRYRDLAADTAYTVSDLDLRTGAVGYRADDGAVAVSDFPLQGAFRVVDEATELSVASSFETRVSLRGEALTLESPLLDLDVTGPAVPAERLTANVSARTLRTGAGAAAVTALEASVRAGEARAQLTADGRLGAADAGRLGGDFSLRQVAPRTFLEAATGEPWPTADESALGHLAGSGRWTASADALAIDELDLELDGSRLTGAASVTGFDAPVIGFDLEADEIDVDRYLPPETPEQPAGAEAESGAEPTRVPLELLDAADVDGTATVRRLRASGLELSAVTLTAATAGGTARIALSARSGDGTVTLEGEGPSGGDGPHLAGRATLAGLDPRAMLSAMDTAPETADPEVLTHLSGESRWRLEPTTLALEDMVWRLDDTRLTGTLAIEDFDRLATRFDLTLDRMDVDAYLPPREAEDTEEAPEAEAAEIPVALIRELEVTGDLSAGELILLGMTLRDVDAGIAAAGDTLRLEPVRAGLYGGAYRGSIVVDANVDPAQVTLDQHLAGVQAGEVLESFFGSDLLAGTLTVDLSGAGTGNTAADLLRRLAGDLSLELDDGAYRGMDVGYEIARARALLQGDAPPPTPEDRETPISNLTLAGAMRDGVLQTDRVSAATPVMRITGDGGVDLMALALDYDLTAVLVEDDAGDGRLGDLAGLEIPLSLEGPLRSPKVGVDLEALVGSGLRRALEQRAREALQDDTGDQESSEETTGDGAEEEDAESETSPRDEIERRLRDLFEPRQ